jgi:hypothetical protein
MMEERREFGRRQSVREGFVRVPLRAPLPCRLVDVSPKGALLEIPQWDHIPQKFKLTIGNYETECDVKHREKARIGVHFATPFRFDPREA